MDYNQVPICFNPLPISINNRFLAYMDIFDSCLNPNPPQRQETQIDGGGDGDVFESSLSLEKSHIEEGYSDGHRDGLVLGKQEGYEVGLKNGFECGEEVGFYRGLVDVWTAVMRVEPDCFSVRIKKTILQMRELIEKYPLMDPKDESKDEIVEGLRLKFKAVCATLGIKPEYNGYPKKPNSDDVDF